MMAAEYKKAAHEKGEEPYKTDKKDEQAKSLDNWGKEEWQTSDGSGNAKQADGTEKRYLPKKAWENMTEEEKAATNKEKENGSKEGKQFVPNTKKAAASRAKAQKHDDDEKDEKEASSEEEETSAKEDGKSSPKRKRGKAASKKEETKEEDGEKATKKQKMTPAKSKKAASAKKSDAESSHEESSSKEEDDEKKDNGAPPAKGTSKKAKPTAPAGTKDRLPEKGQTVTFHALPGYVEGSVVKILTSATTVNGKKVAASKDDPRILIKSHGPTGKQCVHKPNNVYF